MSEVGCQHDSGVATITISNPSTHNAMTLEMWRSFARAVEEMDAHHEVRVIVVKGAGDRSFVSGADAKEFENLRGDPALIRTYDASVASALSALTRSGKPVLASISGTCMGGGMALAAACDVRICNEEARFSMPAARIGLGYEAAGVQRFVDLLGIQNTLEIFLTGRILDAATASRLGFVNEKVPSASLQETVDRWTTSIKANAPLTLRAIKLSVRAATALAASYSDEIVCAQSAVDICNESSDYREGLKAFSEKREPRFNGR